MRPSRPADPGGNYRTHHTGAWRVDLPVTLTGGPVSRLSNPELTSMAVYRGWIGDAPMSVAISVRPRAGETIRSECRRLRAGFRDLTCDEREVSVRGANDARRLDGLMTVEEGLGRSEDWTEQVTSVIAARGKKEFLILTVRRRPGELAEEAEAIVRSFELEPSPHQDSGSVT